MNGKRESYIPRQSSKFRTFVLDFYEVVSVNGKTWGLTADEINELMTAKDTYLIRLDEAQSEESTHSVVVAKDEARKELEKIIRGMVKYKLQNPMISDEMRAKMGLPIHDTNPTPHPRPESRPKLTVKMVDVGVLAVHFQDFETGSKAKPFGVNGAVIIWAIRDTPTIDTEDLGHSVLATRTPHVLEFSSKDRGKIVYMAACWQNEKGQCGHWSEIVNSIIP
jgi:hypothetical protein